MNQILFSLETGTVVRRAGDTSFPVNASIVEHKAPHGPVEVTLHDHELVRADELADLRRIAAEGSSNTIADVLRVIRAWKDRPDEQVPRHLLETVARNLELEFGVLKRPDQDVEDSRAAWRCVCGHYNHPDFTVCDLCHAPRSGERAALPRPRDIREEVGDAIGLATEALDNAGRPSHGVAILAAAILARRP